MGRRREGREAAIQFLFARDLQGESKPEDAEVFWTLHSAKTSTRAFAENLIQGVLSHQEQIDSGISKLLENFSFERLAAVDRNVLRVASYELLYCPEVPTPVILNEAIDIAKALSAGESGSFVNGVLDKLAKSLRKPGASAPAPHVS
ncbi:transcription antitermination factor NusB [Prosthecobacter sp.]|uniref:transcription antitermination factor NusB n=1 Tax=Prosthecobacter sp. TaxID=1965333 RepID=UPI001DE77B3E|nr:transcription antitermination factor NusB [Prosthecobacter sp.]MCB1276277.1 transcription antitermination factor NusB [Prosthecobacter sp.]